jgi:hypothetical protein
VFPPGCPAFPAPVGLLSRAQMGGHLW